MGKGEVVVITTAEQEDVGTHIHLCSAQLSRLHALGLWQEAAGGTWRCATFQHCLSSPSGCAGMLPPVLAMLGHLLSSWQGSPTLSS